MQLGRFVTAESRDAGVGVLEGGQVVPLRDPVRLSEVLHAPDPVERALGLMDRSAAVPVEQVRWLAPIDDQEVWGAGVTYERSKVARQEESETGGSFYDQVYQADRPELFFKATPSRVVGPGEAVRIRRDTAWSVPEPELTLVLDPGLRVVGYTIGNDMSARDIEGRNPLYLPQAKVYDGCCALGPVVTLAGSLADPRNLQISLTIEREGRVEYDGQTSTARMARSFEDLVQWLGRDNSFRNGAFLLTGTGLVPPDAFSLRSGDVVRIAVPEIGVLTNRVVQGSD